MKIERKPEWLRVSLGAGIHYTGTLAALENGSIHTVCRSAKCPNRAECWSRGTATFMILGDVCTRNCRFCAVSHGRPTLPDDDEPARVAIAAAKLGLKCVVITSVTRDDLPDGGAAFWANVVCRVRAAVPSAKIEILTPDFKGDSDALSVVFQSRPDVFAHNVETVKRLQKSVRLTADYNTSLAVLKAAADFGLAVKSGIMLGLGETDDEIDECLCDMRANGVSLVTLGQYMRPSPAQTEVVRWVAPEEFEKWGRRAKELGFSFVKSAPLVRSSYHASDAFQLDK